MKIVIACAGSKRTGAGLMRTIKGKSVKFVAQPKLAPQDTHYDYAMPDDISDYGASWRARLCAYNAMHEKNGDNPFGLLSARELYKSQIYGKLVEKYSAENVYILSAGWGLVLANFLLPDYDITYKQNVKKEDKYKCRQRNDGYKDFNKLQKDSTDRVVFFGGNDYLEPFCELTKGYAGERICFYATIKMPEVKCVVLKKYRRSFTNWHYCAAQELIDGKPVL